MGGINFSGGGSVQKNEKDKTIYIKGTEKRDEIEITQADDFVRVRIGKEFQVISTYGVEKIDVKALGGSDLIRFEDKRLNSGSSLQNLSLNIDGGDGDDTIYGGAGDDIIHGGKGNDEIYGEGGTDKLYGDEGDDFLKSIFNDPGKTKLIGGHGKDQTYKDGELKAID